MTSAIIQTGGKQYRVIPGQLLQIEKLEGEVGSILTFDKVLLVSDGATVTVGAPFVSGQVVTAEVMAQGRGKKIRVFTYKSKKRQRRTMGHRQSITTIKVSTIGAQAKSEKAVAAEKPATAAKPVAKKPVTKKVAE